MSFELCGEAPRVSSATAGLRFFFKIPMTWWLGDKVFPPPAFLSFFLVPKANRLDQGAPRNENDQAILVGTENTFAPQLSTRKKSILRCLIEGDSNKCIARKIDIAEATVKVHVKAILRKIRVQNRTQAAIWGM